jgi:hypothetical protein
MKFSFIAGIMGQIGTLLIYRSLFKYIHDHNKEMLKNKIISSDMFQHRRNVNIFTMAGQIVTFLVELSFYVPMSILLNIVEERNLPRALFIVAFFRMTQSGLVSTVQVFSSTELRKKLFSYFSRK